MLVHADDMHADVYYFFYLLQDSFRYNVYMYADVYPYTLQLYISGLKI